MIFINMSNLDNHKIIKRFILKMLEVEYPMVEDIKVISYNNSGKYFYNIFLGIKYQNSLKLDKSDIRDKVYGIFSKLFPYDTIEKVSFYDPSFT